MSTTRQSLMGYLTVAILFGGNLCLAQSGDGLRYKVRYKCNGENVVVDYCRHDSDMPGFPRTLPQNDYCSVSYPDRPPRNGIIVPSVILRRDIVGQLQACGALPKPMGWTPMQAPIQENAASEVLALANKYFEAKDYAKALEQYQKVLTLKADTATLAMANLKIGFIYDNSNQFDKALLYLRESTRLGPGNGGAFYEMGYAYSSLKQYGEALSAFQRSVQLLPTDKSARYWLGSTEVSVGRIDDALTTYRILQRLSPDDANDLYEEITKADLDTQEQKQAVAKRAEAYRNLDPSTLLAKANQGDIEAMKRLAELSYEKKDNASGLKWEINAAERGDPESQNKVGWHYENTSPKNDLEARKWFVKAGEQGLDTAELNLCQSYAAEFDLDQGVLRGVDRNNLQSPIAPLRASKADIDEAYRWCERGGDRGLYLAAWYAGVLNAKGSSERPPNYEDAYFWLTNGGLPAGAAFREKVGTHLTPAQRSELEKLSAGFHPDPMTVLHDLMQKRIGPPK